MEEIDVSFTDTDTESSDSRRLNHGERIHVHGENVECTGMSEEGTVDILGNLPGNMLERVRFDQTPLNDDRYCYEQT